MPENDSDYLKKHEFENKKELRELEFTSIIDLFNTISKDKFGFFDLTENIKDFEDYDQYSSNEYFKDKIEKIKEMKV